MYYVHALVMFCTDAGRSLPPPPPLTPSPAAVATALRMSEKGYFPLPDIVTVDPDLFKAAFPEWPEYLRHCPDTAGSLTRRESGYLVEIAQEVGRVIGKRGVSRNLSVLDGEDVPPGKS